MNYFLSVPTFYTLVLGKLSHVYQINQPNEKTDIYNGDHILTPIYI